MDSHDVIKGVSFIWRNVQMIHWLHALRERRDPPAYGHVFSLFVSITCVFVCVCVQIAPAESPECPMRMVIITGPPEAQFKVKTKHYECE